MFFEQSSSIYLCLSFFFLGHSLSHLRCNCFFFLLIIGESLYQFSHLLIRFRSTRSFFILFFFSLCSRLSLVFLSAFLWTVSTLFEEALKIFATIKTTFGSAFFLLYYFFYLPVTRIQCFLIKSFQIDIRYPAQHQGRISGPSLPQ